MRMRDIILEIQHEDFWMSIWSVMKFGGAVEAFDFVCFFCLVWI
jgi:hypothetical protein